MNTLYINYTKTGSPVPDHQVESNILSQVDIWVNGQDKQYNVSTENVIAAARAMKLTGRITCNLKLMFEGKELDMNEHCNLSNYPIGFCDYGDGWAFEIVQEQMRRHKEHIENQG